MKKAPRETQTPLTADPLPGTQDGQNLITYERSLVNEDRCMQFQVIVVTDPHTNTAINPQTGPITICCAARLSA